MIISAEKARLMVDGIGEWTDERIEMALDAIEQTVRAYTNNNFQRRSVRAVCDVIDGELHGVFTGFSVGDTVQITASRYSDGLYTVTEVDGAVMACDELQDDEPGVLVTKVVYPADVIACALNMLKWEAQSRGKVGIQSETLSRHSVTYFAMDGENSVMGYPRSLLGCLKAYRKARF